MGYARGRKLACVKTVGLALALAMSSAACGAAEAVNLMLNWTPTADHSPFYYAKAQGWYEKAGIDLTIETGKGSGVSSLKVGSGGSPFGIADLATMLVARSKGADAVAIMSIYANTGQTFYWLKSYGVNGPKDFPGHKIGNPPGDAARALWPALAKANGVDPGSVTWVNIAPNAKLAALKAGSVDAVTDFYNDHHTYKAQLGDDMGYLAWKDAGVDPYGNSIVVNGAYLKAHPEIVAAFVKVTQKAFAACVADAKPCIEALAEANSGLKIESQTVNWHEVEQLMSDKTSQSVALGWFDAKRMEDTYDLVSTYVGLAKPFDVGGIYTDEFLDKSIKMKPIAFTD